MEIQERTKMTIRRARPNLRQNATKNRNRNKRRLLRDAYQSLREVLDVPQDSRYVSNTDILYLAMERIKLLNLCLQIPYQNSTHMLENFGSGWEGEGKKPRFQCWSVELWQKFFLSRVYINARVLLSALYLFYHYMCIK